MPNLKKSYFIMALIIFLTGCTQLNKTPDTPKKKLDVVKKEKETVKKIKKNPIVTYDCSNHTKVMIHASNYIFEEFEKGYFIQKDVVGAKAQLFLIESKSPTIFAKNINAAQKSFLINYKIAKKNRCNLTKFRIFPLTKVKNKIEALEEIIKNENL